MYAQCHEYFIFLQGLQNRFLLHGAFILQQLYEDTSCIISARRSILPTFFSIIAWYPSDGSTVVLHYHQPYWPACNKGVAQLILGQKIGIDGPLFLVPSKNLLLMTTLFHSCWLVSMCVYTWSLIWLYTAPWVQSTTLDALQQSLKHTMLNNNWIKINKKIRASINGTKKKYLNNDRTKSKGSKSNRVGLESMSEYRHFKLSSES